MLIPVERRVVKVLKDLLALFAAVPICLDG
jgi:hypothetical protein